MLIGAVAIILSGRIPWRLASVLSVVYVIVAMPGWPIDFDRTIGWHWYYVYLPTIACHAVIVAQSAMMIRAGKPSGVTFLVLAILMLMTRLGLAIFGGGESPNLLYGTTYFMDSVVILAFGGAFLMYAQQVSISNC
ncbi:MAG: hypothetical protein U5O39_11325 [Gammaproteobacteria bacterium]|nr:hypothetical protein [Gammaproteobacteria bacterium]